MTDFRRLEDGSLRLLEDGSGSRLLETAGIIVVIVRQAIVFLTKRITEAKLTPNNSKNLYLTKRNDSPVGGTV